MSKLTTWILVSVALTSGLAVLALVIDFLAERLSKKDGARKIVRRVLLIETTEKVADFVHETDFQKLSIRIGVGLALLLVGSAVIPIAAPILLSIVIKYFFWLVAILAALIVLGFFASRAKA